MGLVIKAKNTDMTYVRWHSSYNALSHHETMLVVGEWVNVTKTKFVRSRPRP